MYKNILRNNCFITGSNINDNKFLKAIPMIGSKTIILENDLKK